MKRFHRQFSLPFAVAMCLLLVLSVCNKVEDETIEHERAEDLDQSTSEGCDPDAASVCAAYYRCTGTHLPDCLATVCDHFDDEARACILAVTDCYDIRACLPQQGDDGIFEDEDDDDATDDDTADDDDATEEELLKNKDFDQGATAVWVQYSSGGYDLILHQDDVSESDAHTAGYLVYMGGYNNANDSIYQAVTLPATAASATLSCYIKILTLEAGTANDHLQVRLRNSSGVNLLDIAEYSNVDAVADWTQKSWDISVSSWAGQEVQLYLNATSNAADPTSFLVDTCSFLVD